jgi:murein L,D-transpeptidase YafK
MRFINTSLLLPLILTIACSGGVRADGMDDATVSAGEYSLEIDKSTRQLLIRRGTHIARKYSVAVGSGGRGDKQFRGDNKTPEGVYYVAGFNDESAFDIFIRLNYPNVKDGFFGLQRSLITRVEFDRIVDAQRQDALPPQDTPLGGAIGIHGLGEETPRRLNIHEHRDWTKGCIALTNREIQELRNFVDVGTRVVIRE